MEDPKARGRNTGTGEEFFHVGLGTLEASTLGARAHDGLTLSAKVVCETLDERLLGSDHEEIGLEFRRGRTDARDAMCGNAGVARRHDDFPALGEGPRQGVFARA